MRSADPNLSWLGNADVWIGDISGGQVVVSPQPVQLRLYQGTPPGHVLHFELEATSGLASWSSILEVPVSGAELIFQDANLLGFGTSIDPGESGEITVVLRNTSLYSAPGPITAMLASDSYSIQVIDATGSYGTILPDATGTNTSNTFRIMSPSDCIPGQLASLRLELVCSDGIRLSVPFTLPVGTADVNDPTGPDAYGYWCYDQTDTGYADAPHYQWIDINPTAGGPGTSADLTDYGSTQDDSRTLNLPFTFTFYGQPFDRVTACSNGWLAMGHTYVVCYRNWQLPSAEGPANMIAGFWDDLYQSGTNKVYYWSDTANHRFVVAWDMVRNDYGGGTESFEIILYDPAYYPTVTGDGIIEVMYERIQDTDSEQMFSTAGIQNADHSTGINYCYYVRRPATAAPFADGLALRYTTGAPGYSGVPQPGAGSETRLLLSNEPNPWSEATTIRFELGEPQTIRLVVFDLDGRRVRTLHEGVLPAGAQALEWSGADEAGTPLPAGVYFYRLETPERIDTRRMLLVR